jgi:hypothetical protein
MPRHLNHLYLALSAEAAKARALASLSDQHAVLPAGRGRATRNQVERVYEAAFLRFVCQWESFLEEAFVRLRCGFVTSHGPVAHQHGLPKCRDIAAARAALLRPGRTFVLWHDVGTVVKRSRGNFVSGPHETVLASHQTALEHYIAVRHRIAHLSPDARIKLDAATIALVGTRFPGGSAGAFLRSWKPGVAPAKRWLEVITNEFEQIARQIV